ncbi:flagellar hook-length control protein FliK [unidentified bacterial endosymbiont]|uniref:flagellar hook-length control protein FliK n=1 Tax=unidentified bacterial endosymbiont TaxID=2355 RepID=UPI00209E2633|nr:flagellar hook-length control protein FliK [unidentified bacterial endosymbiont]
MNSVLLAAPGSLTDIVAENGAVPALNAAPAAGAFSLPQAAERLYGAKITQQQAQHANRDRENDPAVMQALLALLLPTPALQTQPAALTPRPGGERVAMLATAQPQSGVANASGLRQWASALAQKGQDAAQQPADVLSLPPALQGLLVTLNQPVLQAQATPEQQAALASLFTQNVRAIFPAQPSPSQQSAGRVKPADEHIASRPQVIKKSERAAPAVQNLSSVAPHNTPAIGTPVSHRVISAHVSPLTEMSPDELGEKLTALLKDRIQFQIGQQQQTSTIRLDPPSLGKLEIAVQLDAGKLTVHIGASQSDVCRSLQQFSHDLRQHLTAQNFMEVNVQVSSDGQSQQQQQSGHQQEEVMSALSLSDESQHLQNEYVLIKV